MGTRSPLRSPAGDGRTSAGRGQGSRARALSAARAGAAIPSRAAERTASPHPVLLSIQKPPLGFAEAPTAEPSALSKTLRRGAHSAPNRIDEPQNKSYRLKRPKESKKGEEVVNFSPLPRPATLSTE